MTLAQRWGRRRKTINDTWRSPRYSVKVLVPLCLALLTAEAKRDAGKLAACAGKSIYVMDVGMFSKENGMPSCNLATDIKIDPMNGIPFLPDAWQVKHVEKGAPIAIAAHSGPWHLRQTIRGSAHHTTDMDEADIIYVYDHCYYMRWLAQVHSNGPKDQKTKSEAGEWLMKGYHALKKTERWKRNNGADFVFFDPHPGFTDGTSDRAFKTMMCQTSKDSMHIVVERGQVNICPVAPMIDPDDDHPWRLMSVVRSQDYFDIHDKLLIAPYVAGSSDTSKPLLGFKAPVKPIKERKTFLYLTASCLPYFYANANQTKVTGGKQFRHAVQLFLGNLSPDINLQCVDPTLGGHYTPFPQVLETMQDTVFCLMMPGDSASSRRTSEIFMSGCIPVFIGPPYATMPLGEAVKYKEAAYIFNITDHKFWFDSEMLWENPKDVRPYHVQTPWYWFPDSDVADAMIKVKSLQAMLKYLRGIKEAELNKKLAALAVERFKFAYRHKLSSTDTATSVIMSHMCAKYDATPAGGAGAGKAAAEPEEEEEDEEER